MRLPFSLFVEKNGFVFTSGRVYIGPDGKLIEGTIEEKTHAVMKNLEEILKSAGTSFENVVKTTVYITDMANYDKISEVYASYFKEPYPARETVCVRELPLGAEVEISMIAAK